jgi:hypothetical protein
MDVVAAIGAQGLDRPPLVLGAERAHPQHEAAAIELLLEAVGVALLEEAREGGADQTTATTAPAAAQAPT